MKLADYIKNHTGYKLLEPTEEDKAWEIVKKTYGGVNSIVLSDSNIAALKSGKVLFCYDEYNDDCVMIKYYPDDKLSMEVDEERENRLREYT